MAGDLSAYLLRSWDTAILLGVPGMCTFEISSETVGQSDSVAVE